MKTNHDLKGYESLARAKILLTWSFSSFVGLLRNSDHLARHRIHKMIADLEDGRIMGLTVRWLSLELNRSE